MRATFNLLPTLCFPMEVFQVDLQDSVKILLQAYPTYFDLKQKGIHAQWKHQRGCEECFP